MKITRPIVGITALVIASAIAAVKFRSAIVETWHHNPTANTAIMSLLVIGLIYSMVCAVGLWRGKRQWNLLKSQQAPWSDTTRLAGVMRLFKDRFHEALGSRDAAVREEVIDAFETMLHMRARMAEYMAGLLIGLGLLGTFLGLMETMGSIGGVLATLNGPGGADPGAMMEGLSKPLSGMSSAFSASLLGLLGSLLMGAVAQLMSDANDNLVQELRGWSQHEALSHGVSAADDGNTVITGELVAAAGATAHDARWVQQEQRLLHAHGQVIHCLEAQNQLAHRRHEAQTVAESVMLASLQDIQRASEAQASILGQLGHTLSSLEQAFGKARQDQVRSAQIIASGVGALDECRITVGAAVGALSDTLSTLAINGDAQLRQLQSVERAVNEGVTSSRVLESSLAIQRQSMLEAVRHISAMASRVGRDALDTAEGELA
jgi:hypothetical protein